MAISIFNILQADQLSGQVKFVGGNTVGPKLEVEMLNVTFRPANNPIGLIQEEWGEMQLTGEVLADATGSFGTIKHPDDTITEIGTNSSELLYIGKGIVSVMIDPAIAYRDIGECPTFEFVPNITTLPYFSSRFGIRTKILEVNTEKTATLNITLNSWSSENIKLAFLGLVPTP